MSGEPGLSVVVAASWSAEASARTVASIGMADGVEVVVVSDPGRVAPGPLPDGARWIEGGRGDGVPRLRKIGAEATRGRVVAFLEDACVLGAGWTSAIRDAFHDGDLLAATGPVFQAEGASAVDWAVYFAEYAAFAGRGPTHGDDLRRVRCADVFGASASIGDVRTADPTKAPAARLAGINFACRRGVLGPSETVRESEIVARLAGSTRRLDAATVHHTRRYEFSEAVADRWRFGREFGRDRWADRPGHLRRLGLAAAPVILAIQLARLVWTAVRYPRLIGPLLGSSPPTLALLTAWSSGEATGWAESRPGSRRCGRAGRTPASAADQAGISPVDCKRPQAVA